MEGAQRRPPPVKVLVVCYEYPPVGGGGGRLAAQVAEALAQRGHEVKVITAGLKHLPEREIVGGVEIFRPPSFRKKEDTCTVPEMGLYVMTNVLPALRLVGDWKPDVMHVHFAVPSGAVGLKLHFLTSTPYVLTAHLGDVPGGVPEQTDHLFRLLNPLIRPIWHRAAGVTAVSKFVAGLARKAYGIEPLIIPNGVASVSRPEIIMRETPQLVFVGRFSIQKNPLLAIEALARISELPWHLEMIGEGPLGPEVRERISRLGLHGRITLSGWLDKDAVAQRMARADVLLMTSKQEGLPMAAIEALQHGLAIVASDIGGMQDVIENHRNGLLCPLSSGGFAAGLRSLLTSPTTLNAYRRASLEKAPDFHLPRIVETYERVLLDAAGLRG